MLGNMTGWHVLIVILVILLLFGAAKLPALARSAGQSVRILRSEVSSEKDGAKEAGSDNRADEATGGPQGQVHVAGQAGERK